MFKNHIEKEVFAYSKWIVEPSTWGGATEITIISKVYQTKVCVIDDQGSTYNFGEEYRSVVYLMYTGMHYNAVIAKDKNGITIRKFPRGDLTVLSSAKDAVKEFLAAEKEKK